MTFPKYQVVLSTEEINKYDDEINTCNNNIVQHLSTVVDRGQIARYLFYLDKHEALADPPVLASPNSIGAVLRKPDIEYFCNQRIPPLIDPLDTRCLRESASYELRLGSRYRVGNSDTVQWLTDSQKLLTIPPHSIAVVSTYEWLNIPGCLIARWNLKVRMVYRGLVWVGSLQVDPGYQGFLFCPIYNLSDRPQTIIYKEPLFIIDFVLTTPTDKYGLWPLRGSRYSTFDFDRLDEEKIRSAPEHSFTDIRKEMSTFQEQTKASVKELSEKVERNQDVSLVFVSIIIAAIGIISAFGLGSVTWDFSWIPAVLAFFALVAAGFAIFIAVKNRSNKNDNNNKPERKE